MESNVTRILKINSSARIKNSFSRTLTGQLVTKLLQIHKGARVTEQALPGDLPFLSETMTDVMFGTTPGADIEKNKVLHVSNNMANELLQTDILVLGVPVYNFGIPASLKAYIDLIIRAGITFHYTKKGPVGLVEKAKAYIVVVSGSTALNSDNDFVSGYLRTALGFIGIEAVHFIDATQISTKGTNTVMSNAALMIDNILGKEEKINYA